MFDEVFKDEYKRIVGEDIRNELADTRFNEFIQHKNIITGEGMGKDIEEAINASRTFLPIESNDKLKIILDLIKGISNNPDRWSKWLPYINKVKEEILMHKFKEEKTRNSLFTILSESEDKINLLGELAKISDLNSLIKAGKEKQREEKRKSKHFEYIKKIGLDIQLLIENQLNTELSQVYKLAESSNDTTLQTVEEQNGQDFIIYRTEKGTNDTIPVFYIEVKSRWDSEGIVALSKRQIECCARNSDKYAVITVNVADYKSRNNIVDEEITFDELKEDVYVNLDLSDEFYKLIKQNSLNEKVENQSKLIEFRGHIPQSKIKGELASSINFNDFINHLRTKLK